MKNDPPGRFRWPLIIIGCLLLPVVYVLSYPPVAILLERFRCPDALVEVVAGAYIPYVWLVYNCPPFQAFHLWYYEFWS